MELENVEVIEMDDVNIEADEPMIKTHEKQGYFYDYQIEDENYSYEFDQVLMNSPESFRNVCLVGNYQSGKTHLLDMLLKK